MTDPASSVSAPTTDRAVPAVERRPAPAPRGAAGNILGATDRQRHQAQSLIYGGLAALMIAGYGLLLVGLRRRLW